jgi:hypothetical protein
MRGRRSTFFFGASPVTENWPDKVDGISSNTQNPPPDILSAQKSSTFSQEPLHCMPLPGTCSPR